MFAAAAVVNRSRSPRSLSSTSLSSSSGLTLGAPRPRIAGGLARRLPVRRRRDPLPSSAPLLAMAPRQATLGYVKPRQGTLGCVVTACPLLLLWAGYAGKGRELTRFEPPAAQEVLWRKGRGAAAAD